MMIERRSMSVMMQAVIWTAVILLNCNLMQIMIMFSDDP